MTAAGHAARRLSRWLWAVPFWGGAAHACHIDYNGPCRSRSERLELRIWKPADSIALAALVAAFLAEVLTLVTALWKYHKEIV